MIHVDVITIDARPIRSILCPPTFECGWIVDGKDVTAIVPYAEHGPMGYYAALAIHRGQQVIARVAAHHVEVQYETEASDD